MEERKVERGESWRAMESLWISIGGCLCTVYPGDSHELGDMISLFESLRSLKASRKTIEGPDKGSGKNLNWH